MLRNLPDIGQEEFPLFDRNYLAKCYLNILEFHEHIWNHHKKSIQKSTNMPGIGSIICEIGVQIDQILHKSSHNFQKM